RPTWPSLPRCRWLRFTCLRYLVSARCGSSWTRGSASSSPVWRCAADEDYARRVTHRIRIARAEHKFSCAHMTVFADGTKERLHGHNYTVAVAIEVERVDVQAMIPFAPIKAAIAELCAAWRERVLLAAGNPWFEILSDGDRDADELEFRLCGARYVLP